MKSASCQRLRWGALSWLDVLGSMQPLFFQSLRLLLTDYSPLLSRQSFFPPPPLIAPPSVSQTLRQQIEQESCVLVASSVFLSSQGWSPPLRSRRSEGGTKEKTMDLCALFLCLLCLCFHASAATSLITGKTGTQKTPYEKSTKSWFKCGSVFGFLLECCHDFLLDVWILKRIYLKPKVGKTFDSNSFGFDWCREEIQLVKLISPEPHRGDRMHHTWLKGCFPN